MYEAIRQNKLRSSEVGDLISSADQEGSSKSSLRKTQSSGLRSRFMDRSQLELAQAARDQIIATIREMDARSGAAAGVFRARLIMFFADAREDPVGKSGLEAAGLKVPRAGFFSKETVQAMTRTASRKSSNAFARLIEDDVLSIDGSSTPYEEEYGLRDHSGRLMKHYNQQQYSHIGTKMLPELPGNKKKTKLEKIKAFLGTVKSYAANVAAVPYAAQGWYYQQTGYNFPRDVFAEEVLGSELASKSGLLSAPVENLQSQYVQWCGSDAADAILDDALSAKDKAQSPFYQQLQLRERSIYETFEVPFRDLMSSEVDFTLSQLELYIPSDYKVNLLQLFFESGRALPSFDVQRACPGGIQSQAIQQVHATLSSMVASNDILSSEADNASPFKAVGKVVAKTVISTLLSKGKGFAQAAGIAVVM